MLNSSSTKRRCWCPSFIIALEYCDPSPSNSTSALGVTEGEGGLRSIWMLYGATPRLSRLTVQVGQICFSSLTRCVDDGDRGQRPPTPPYTLPSSQTNKHGTYG